MKRRISISLRLTLWFAVVFFAGWTFFGVSMFVSLRRTLTNERHQTLARRNERLEQLLSRDAAASFDDRNQDFIDFAHATGNGLARVCHADGSPVFASPSASAAAFPWPLVQAGNADVFVRVPVRDQSYWVLAQAFPFQGQPLVLMTAAPDAGNQLLIRGFLSGLLALAPALLLIASGAGYWLSRRALRPVDRIAATARSISIRNISERIPVSGPDDELQRLTETCNAMLDRLEASVTQIKRFTADASHELRGPLTFTRTVAEIALRDPEVAPGSRAALQDIVNESVKAAAMLDEMLTLARADAAPSSLALLPVPLHELLEEVCSAAQPIAAERGLHLSLTKPAQPVAILGDTPALKRLAWILLDNAIKYSRPNGTIKVNVDAAPGSASLVVQDDGIGISPADLPFIFHRFYRADPSRSLVEGNGLGLAIAEWIAAGHLADVTVASTPGEGATFRVTFPLSETNVVRGVSAGS